MTKHYHASITVQCPNCKGGATQCDKCGLVSCGSCRSGKFRRAPQGVSSAINVSAEEIIPAARMTLVPKTAA